MIDSNGFSRPTYAELVTQLSYKWRELFGDNAQTNSKSVGGILIRILAYILDKLYKLAEVVYNSQFVDSAEGTTLDQLASNAGISRLPAQVAIGTIKIWGQAGYVVPTGTLFKTSDELMYVTTEDIVLEDISKKTLDIDGYGTIQAVSGNLGIGTSRLLYANELGMKYNKDGTFTLSQVTPVETIMYATLEEVYGGADIESDESLRKRIALSNASVPASPYNGVLAGISKVSGVKSVKIIANDTMQDDSTNNTPAKSLHIYVDGGYKEDIAGISHEIAFDYPENKKVYVKIHIEKGDMYPNDGNARIKEIVQTYISSVGMGNVLHYTKLYQRIYSEISGIVVADIKVGFSLENVKAEDIQLKNFETAELADNGLVIE
ncbi:baseplate J/gp47 family protein [Ligilactobacillus sp. MP3]|uniref:baseplate J/gp47 family protein n=1 Tax=Ligilactobacillus sp. MP3 TaxID=2965103 RepID=UPI00210C5C7D|nr:baseplate J/gp47 family protein [Ligilactobacillus sp. MP3]